MRVDFDATGLQIAEGFRGTATVEFMRADNAVVVPLAALSQVEGKQFVVVAKSKGSSTAVARVTTGIRTEEEVEILSGVDEGDYVVITM